MAAATNAYAYLPLALSLTASSTAAGYDPSYVTNDYAGVVWQSASGLASVQLVADLGTPQSVDTAHFFGCTNASTNWTLTVESADDAGFTTNAAVIASGIPFLAGSAFPTHGRGVGYWAGTAGTARRYWRFTIGNLGNQAVTVSRLTIGKRLVLDRNFSIGAAAGVRDMGKVDFSASGVRLRRRGAKLRVLGISFDNVRKDEVDQKVQPLIEWVAGQEPIVIVTDPTVDAQRQTRCFFGHLTGDGGGIGTTRRNAAAWKWQVNMIDLIPVPSA